MISWGRLWWRLLGIGFIMFGIYFERMWGCASVETTESSMITSTCSPMVGGTFCIIGLAILVTVHFLDMEEFEND